MVDSRRAPTVPDSLSFTCESAGMVIGELRGKRVSSCSVVVMVVWRADTAAPRDRQQRTRPCRVAAAGVREKREW